MSGTGRRPRLDAASDLVGVVTLAFGGALTASPDRAAHALRLDPARARAIGIADLTVGAALLVARPRWPWMAARAALNVMIAREYDAELQRRNGSDRATTLGAVGMRALAVSDAALAAALHSHGR